MKKTNLKNLIEQKEISLIKTIVKWPKILEDSVLSHEPHRITFFLQKLASKFHSLWNMGNDNPQTRFIVEANPEVTRARLALLEGVRAVLVSGLQGIVGVVPQIEMR